MQLDIFDMMYPQFKINKEIALIEFFGGYGSQALGLRYANIPFRHHKLCEWAVNSIQAYKDIHFTDDDTDYSKDLTLEEIRDYLFNKGISKNWNEPMTKEQVNRLKEAEARTIYNNIKATHNLVNIQQVKGEDLEINDKEHFTYLLTYSFPCQDISIAGKMVGFEDTSTRSGMLWEVERILKECKQKPDVLLMENVPLIHSVENMPNFIKWIQSLENMGYKNYWQDLIATDYGIPQTRNRTFMVSVLGDYKYTFPQPIPLKLKLKDMLEDNVDEKYYYIYEFKPPIKNNIKENKNYLQWYKDGYLEHSCRAWKDSEVVETLTTKGETKVLLGKQLLETISKIKEKEIVGLVLYSRRIVDDGFFQTLDTGYHNSQRLYDLKGIRRLTPRECFRLMGVKDEDIDKILKHQSNASAYHLAGDSIVVDVLKYIYLNMI